MKLYYSPGASSLCAHIALHESGLPFEAIAAPTKTHKLSDGTDYYSINPLGYVPLLVLDDGRQLKETSVIVQYIADQAPEMNLAPDHSTFERYKQQEWLSFISSELHKGFAPLFVPGMPQEAKDIAKARLTGRLQWVEGELNGRDYLMGEHFTVADGFLFNVTNWARLVGISLSAYPNLLNYRERVAARPAVQAAMRAEGLIK